ncbi:MAG: TetR/AcrR family transcriptional regulator [Sinobacteraceae bacterium]|nr:TetR/AcrR family transcriptional regulator [Nevskiaceae bacterium]
MNPIRRSSGEACSAAEKKTECIIDAARSVFLQAGYGGATVDAIAAAAGVSKATIYTRFSSKQELFAAVIRQECKACSKRMALAEEMPGPDLAATLQHMAEALLDIILLPQNLAITRVVIAEMPRFPELGQVFYESGPAVTLDNLVGFLQRHMNNGALRIEDVELAAQQFISLLRGDIQWRALMGQVDVSEVARRRVASRTVQAFLRLYATTPPVRR